MLNTLPYDMVINIENFLKVKDILELRLVCKFLNIHDSEYYKILYVNERSLEVIKRFLLKSVNYYIIKNNWFQYEEKKNPTKG